MIWILPCSVIFVMVHNNCRYLYTLSYRSFHGHFLLDCHIPNSYVDTPPPVLIQIVSSIMDSHISLPKVQMELTLQFGIPVFILAMYISVVMKIITMKKASLNRHEMRVLIQAIIIFFLFQVLLKEVLHLSIKFSDIFHCFSILSNF